MSKRAIINDDGELMSETDATDKKHDEISLTPVELPKELSLDELQIDAFESMFSDMQTCIAKAAELQQILQQTQAVYQQNATDGNGVGKAIQVMIRTIVKHRIAKSDPMPNYVYNPEKKVLQLKQ